MDVLKARERAREKKSEKEEKPVVDGKESRPQKKWAGKKKTAKTKKASGVKASKKDKEVVLEEPIVESDVLPEDSSAEPRDSLLDDIPTKMLAPEEMELSEEDLMGLYKTQEMPELPDIDLSFQDKKVEEPRHEMVSPVKIQQKRHVAIEKPPGEEEAKEEAKEESTETPLEFLSFMLGSEEYALPLARISEIIKPRGITEVPRCPGFVLGIISLRGVVIPVFDLAARLNLGNVNWGRRARIAIVRRADEELAGLAVDSVQDVVRVLPSDIEPPPPAMGGVEAQFLEGVGRAEESRRVHSEDSTEQKGAGPGAKQTTFRRKLVILLNLDKVAML